MFFAYDLCPYLIYVTLTFPQHIFMMKVYVALAALMLISTVMGSSSLMKKLNLISPENNTNKPSKITRLKRDCPFGDKSLFCHSDKDCLPGYHCRITLCLLGRKK